jgi:hypothetical protein
MYKSLVAKRRLDLKSAQPGESFLEPVPSSS